LCSSGQPTQQGVAQAVEEAEAKGLITGLVLDAGCGFGDNGIFLASRSPSLAPVTPGTPALMARPGRGAAGEGAEG
jgi:hypothetical protein